MNNLTLLQDLYNAAFSGNIEKVTRITERLINKGVSYRVQNKVLQLAHVSCNIESVVTTIKGIVEEDKLLTVRVPSLN